MDAEEPSQFVEECVEVGFLSAPEEEHVNVAFRSGFRRCRRRVVARRPSTLSRLTRSIARVPRDGAIHDPKDPAEVGRECLEMERCGLEIGSESTASARCAAVVRNEASWWGLRG